ncbi:NUDIX hydrolase [Cognatishimia sp. WU-CL00825]|uniref:NUDIX hydrolase n=1 Tax=Cognatishimia sp. WU-CL00825 TaxID=3127658 RepID=UPI00310489FA
MSFLLKKAWDDFLCPMLQRPKRLQVAALCYRRTDSGKDVLLITSRDTRRWIIPKGWPIKGMDAPQAAMQEAWEEAGVSKGHGSTQSIGSYCYDKRMATGWTVPVETLVFPVDVQSLKDDFPEANERDRKWVPAAEAANLVHEPELRDILRDL